VHLNFLDSNITIVWAILLLINAINGIHDGLVLNQKYQKYNFLGQRVEANKEVRGSICESLSLLI